jgi:hypothetical protein
MPTSNASEHKRVVIALAGRRVDAPDLKQRRFPAENVDEVRRRIGRLFAHRNAAVLVSSAACGADLLALEAAESQHMKRRIVLPFPRDVFRRTSVVDRPGAWGTAYDRVLDQVENENGLVMLGYSEHDSDAYALTNRAILDEAVSLAHKDGLDVAAAVVWDQRSRGPDDITEQFLTEASRRNLEILSVSTL